VENANQFDKIWHYKCYIPGIMILPDTPIMHKIKLIQLSTEFKEIKKSLSINMLPFLIIIGFFIT